MEELGGAMPSSCSYEPVVKNCWSPVCIARMDRSDDETGRAECLYWWDVYMLTEVSGRRGCALVEGGFKVLNHISPFYIFCYMYYLVSAA